MNTKARALVPVSPLSRLGRTLKGHRHELLAAFERSAAHKLPGSKGRLRENALGKFLQTWIPKRYTPLTNVFVTHPLKGEFPLEIDLVLHDAHEGSYWPLDGESENGVVALEHVKAAFEVKSTLGKAEFEAALKTTKHFHEYAENAGIACPRTVLFAYHITEEFHPEFLQWCLEASTSPFDAIVILNSGAYFWQTLEFLRIGFGAGLTPDLVANDGPSQDRAILECMSNPKYPDNMKMVGEGPEDALMALAVLASAECAGNRNTLALYSCLKKQDFNPIFDHY